MMPLPTSSPDLPQEEEYPCAVPGCPNVGIACYLSPDELDGYYCGEHCYDQGFCWGCGYYAAGQERFDFSPQRLCGECQSNADITGEEPDDEDYWEPDDDESYMPVLP